LRSLIESLINKACIQHKINTWVNVKDGGTQKIVELGLTSKFIRIKKFLKEDYSKDTIYNIIMKANSTAHELLGELKRVSSEQYLKDFVIIIKTEEIFNNLNKKNGSTITAASSN